jgi:protein-L-isoaspartate(D-aspartate) O-methyltransferase
MAESKLARDKRALLYYWEKEGTVTDERVLAAFRDVPRERFVPAEYRDQAYDDVALPLPAGQTISQPTTVVLMLHHLEAREGMKVLEVGTGSGYAAALLGKIVGSRGQVYTTEIIPELHTLAKRNLATAGAKNVTLLQADGSNGLARHAPYDRIIVAAAAPAIPQPLIDQLKEGGIILIPVGGRLEQALIRGRKRMGELETESLGVYAFVPLTGGHGASEESGEDVGEEEEYPYEGEE